MYEGFVLWRGGRVVECGGLENRYSVRTGSRVRIPPSPPVIHNIKLMHKYILFLTILSAYSPYLFSAYKKEDSLRKKDYSHIPRSIHLIEAAKKNDTAKLIDLIKNKHRIDATTTSSDKTALYYAIERGHINCIKILLAHGANPNQKYFLSIENNRNMGGKLPIIFKAIESNNCDIVKSLLEHGADPNITIPYANWNGIGYSPTPLYEAIFQNKLTIAEQLLIYKADPNRRVTLKRNNHQQTALNEAIQRDNLAAVKLLLKYKANPNACTHTKSVRVSHPLLLAKCANKEITTYLIANGSHLAYSFDTDDSYHQAKEKMDLATHLCQDLVVQNKKIRKFLLETDDLSFKYFIQLPVFSHKISHKGVILTILLIHKKHPLFGQIPKEILYLILSFLPEHMHHLKMPYEMKCYEETVLKNGKSQEISQEISFRVSQVQKLFKINYINPRYSEQIIKEIISEAVNNEKK